MKRYIDEINNNITNIRTAIQEQGVDINENTPLDKYAEKIKSIEKTKVTVGHAIIPFYCYAENYYDVSSEDNKAKPEITWNSDTGKWDVKDGKDGWTKDVPEKSTPGSLLYAMFVPIKYGQNSNDDDFKWPTPIQIQGKQGEKGDTGRDGRDGVIAGMVQYLAAHLFKVIRRSNVETELQNKPKLKYNYAGAKNQGEPEPNFLYTIPVTSDDSGNITSYLPASVSDNGGWGLSYTMPENHPEDYVVLKCVASYNSVDDTVTVTDPIMLSGEGVDSHVVWYKVLGTSESEPVFDPERAELLGWSKKIPGSFYLSDRYENTYLWSCTQIKYDSGRILNTNPVCILSQPNSIINTVIEYGISNNISNQPTEWKSLNELPHNYIVLWQKTTTKFALTNDIVTITPVAIKGDPGVDILAQVKKDDIDSWTSTYMQNFNDSEFYFKKGILVNKDLYIWCGDQSPEWTQDYYCTPDGYYWIVLTDAFISNVCADWNENDENNLNYIKNRTHYTEYEDARVPYRIVRLDRVSNNVTAHFDPTYKLKSIYVRIPMDDGQYKGMYINTDETVVLDEENDIWIKVVQISDGIAQISWQGCEPNFDRNEMRVYAKKVTNIPNEYVNMNHSITLPNLFALISNEQLIPGHKYTFLYMYYDGPMRTYVATAINKKMLSPYVHSLSNKWRTGIVNWTMSGFVRGWTCGDLDTKLTQVGKYVNTGQYWYDSDAGKWYLGNGYSGELTEVTESYPGNPRLSFVKHIDSNGNEFRNINCSFGNNSKNNIVHGTAKVTIGDSCSNNIIIADDYGNNENEITITNLSSGNFLLIPTMRTPTTVSKCKYCAIYHPGHFSNKTGCYTDFAGSRMT